MSRKRNHSKEYGFQADQRQEMKAKLEAILEVHKQRKEAERTTVEPGPKVITLPPPPQQREHVLPSTEEVRQWTGSDDYEAQQDERPVQTSEGVVFIKDAQEQPNLYIAVRTPEVQDYESAGTVYEVRTGRYLITWRLRRPEDGDAEYVYGEPQYKRKVTPTPSPADPEAKAHADRLEWLRRSLSGESVSQVQWAPGKVPTPTDDLDSGCFGGGFMRPGDRRR
jgi:hypothetical protein